jgi:hypothetical protein
VPCLAPWLPLPLPDPPARVREKEVDREGKGGGTGPCLCPRPQVYRRTTWCVCGASYISLCLVLFKVALYTQGIPIDSATVVVYVWRQIT